MGEIVKREGPDGARFYVRFVDADGVRRMRRAPDEMPRGPGLRLAKGAEAARLFLGAIEARTASGKVGIVEPTDDEKARRRVTVGTLIDRFLEEYRPPRIKDIAEYRKQARSIFKQRIRPMFGDVPAASVTHRDVERMRDAALDANRSPATAARAMKFLSTVYVWARKRGMIDCVSPVVGVEQPRVESSLDYFDAAEVGRLLAHAEAHADELAGGIYPMLAVAVHSGLRKGELFGLRWRDLDLEARRLTVARSYHLLPKSGKARHLRLHPDLVPILRAWREQCPPTDEALVFPVFRRLYVGKPQRWTMGGRASTLDLSDMLSAAGCHVPEKPWHALRHTFASHFIMAGGNILTLQKLLGHADVKMTMIYAHLAPDFMDTEIARMAFPRPTSADVADLAEARRRRDLAEAAAP